MECYSTSYDLDIEQLSLEWCFEGVVPDSQCLSIRLRTIKMHTEGITQSNYCCETIVAASAAKLRPLKQHLLSTGRSYRLRPGDIWM
jgi:hypothetical protein